MSIQRVASSCDCRLGVAETYAHKATAPSKKSLALLWYSTAGSVWHRISGAFLRCCGHNSARFENAPGGTGLGLPNM